VRKRSGAGGFTLVELAVTVAILGVVATIAVPNFARLMPRVRLGTATQTLANGLAMARMSAIAHSLDGEAAFNKNTETYSVAKTIGGAPYLTANLTGVADLESVTYKDGSVAPATLQIYANGTTSVPLPRRAMVITLASTDGTHRKRVLVEATGRIYSEKWAGGTSWVAD